MVQIHSHRPLNSVQSGDILYRPFLRHALHPWAKWVVKVYLKFVQLADFVVDVVDFQFHPAPTHCLPCGPAFFVHLPAGRSAVARGGASNDSTPTVTLGEPHRL